MKSIRLSFLCAAIGLIGLGSAALAQVPSIPPPPYNTPLSAQTAITPTTTKVINSTLQIVGSVSSNIINNLSYRGVHCQINTTAESGDPDVNVEIDTYDAASATYTKVVQSALQNFQGAAFASAAVQVYPGISLTTTPTNWVIESIHLPRWFRAQANVIEGKIGVTSNAAWTGSVGCDLLI